MLRRTGRRDRPRYRERYRPSRVRPLLRAATRPAVERTARLTSHRQQFTPPAPHSGAVFSFATDSTGCGTSRYSSKINRRTAPFLQMSGTDTHGMVRIILAAATCSFFFYLPHVATSQAHASPCSGASSAVTYIWLRLVGLSGSVIFSTPAASIGLI